MNDFTKFWIPGHPKPQGSKKAFVNAKTGRAAMVESCKQVKPWRESIAFIAGMNFKDAPIATPVEMSITFFFPRPKSHYGTGKHSRVLKANAPEYMATPPDLDKLTRAVCDALTGVIYSDDKQICHFTVCKLYATSHGPGAQVSVRAIRSAADTAKGDEP